MTVEEDLIRQITYETGQLARLTANTRVLHRRWIGRAKDRHQVAVTLAEANYRKALHEADSMHGRSVEQARTQAAEIYRRAGLALAGWDDARWGDWQTLRSPTVEQESVRLGHLIEAALAGREVALPAVARLAGGHNLIIKADGPAKAAAADTLQSVLFRLLANTPPGQLRLALLDASGLLSRADTLASLAGHDPGLVTGGVWQEPGDIEAVLAYLSGRWTIGPLVDTGARADIQRVIVILDFPSGFSPEAARHLRTLFQSQRASRVSFIMLWDPSGALPEIFDPDELMQSATVIRWDGERFLWEADEWRSCRLALDAPPGEALAKTIVAAVGAGAAQALPGTLDLTQTLPPEREWWQEDAAHRFCAPIGVRPGGEIAPLCLNEAVHHLLITGSHEAGRGDLMRALLMHWAVTCSPDGLRLYLLSMPGGLDLRKYAAHRLPHAQVVAVDCAREYALSVLEHLDSQLPSCSPPDTRHLLLLDEFSQLLAGSDEIAVRANELLSRLVAPGSEPHVQVVLMTSDSALPDVIQPAADRFSARVTFTKGVPGAGEKNTVDQPPASVLAIYNDAAGKPWGDRLVRVLAVTDADELKLLAQVRSKSQVRSEGFPPQAFHDPGALAELPRCWPLYRRLAVKELPVALPREASAPAETTSLACLGERPLLGQAAAATFWPRDGRHLLIVSDDEAAAGLLAAALLSLGVQAHREPCTAADAQKAQSLTVVDFTSGKLPLLGRVAGVLGPQLEVVSDRVLPALLAKMAELVDRRLDAPLKLTGQDAPMPSTLSPVFVILVGLHQAQFVASAHQRDIEDRFVSAERLARIVRWGPGVGVHIIAWSAALASFNAVLGQAMLSEFEMRAITQVSEDDSIELIGSPAASLLAPNEALLWDRRLGILQPFRVYAPPEDRWLAWVRESVRGRSAARIS